MPGVVARREAKPTEEPPHRAGKIGVPPMTQNQKIIRGKVGVLELAKQLGNVSQACKVMGFEPRRVCRRLFGLSHAAMTCSLAWA